MSQYRMHIKDNSFNSIKNIELWLDDYKFEDKKIYCEINRNSSLTETEFDSMIRAWAITHSITICSHSELPRN